MILIAQFWLLSRNIHGKLRSGRSVPFKFAAYHRAILVRELGTSCQFGKLDRSSFWNRHSDAGRDLTVLFASLTWVPAEIPTSPNQNNSLTSAFVWPTNTFVSTRYDADKGYLIVIKVILETYTEHELLCNDQYHD